MVGVGWESNESRTARDALGRALRHMSDGFLAVDDEWRITFANLEAERFLGFSEEELFGRLLWDLPADRRGPRPGDRCREAAAEEKPAGFDVHMRTPDGGSTCGWCRGPTGTPLFHRTSPRSGGWPRSGSPPSAPRPSGRPGSRS